MKLKYIDHAAIICSNHEVSKHFYTIVLGFTILNEQYREESKSFKLDLALNGKYILELFSFSGSPPRVSNPEACGLRHIAFSVSNIDESVQILKEKDVETEKLRVDSVRNCRFTFVKDPDGLPIELVEALHPCK